MPAGGTDGIMSERGVDLRQGETFTLLAAAARTASVNTGATEGWVAFLGERSLFTIILDITASATAAGDTMDVYIDGSFDGLTQAFNIVHFAQQAGNGAAARIVAVIGSLNPGTATFTVTSDITAGAVRSPLMAPYLRARAVLVDGGGGDTSHTFSVTGYAI